MYCMTIRKHLYHSLILKERGITNVYCLTKKSIKDNQ
jgi:hypothetical protein